MAVFEPTALVLKGHLLGEQNPVVEPGQDQTQAEIDKIAAGLIAAHNDKAAVLDKVISGSGNRISSGTVTMNAAPGPFEQTVTFKTTLANTEYSVFVIPMNVAGNQNGFYGYKSKTTSSVIIETSSHFASQVMAWIIVY